MIYSSFFLLKKCIKQIKDVLLFMLFNFLYICLMQLRKQAICLLNDSNPAYALLYEKILKKQNNTVQMLKLVSNSTFLIPYKISEVAASIISCTVAV